MKIFRFKRDLKTVQETSLTVSTPTRFVPFGNAMTATEIIEKLFRASRASDYKTVYLKFLFTIKTSELSDSLKAYAKNKLKLKSIPKPKNGIISISGYEKFTSVLNNDIEMIRDFCLSLDYFFHELAGNFSSDSVFICTQISLVFSKERKSRKRKFTGKIKRRKLGIKIIKKRKSRNVKISRTPKKKKIKRSKKLRGLRHRNKRRIIRHSGNRRVIRRYRRKNLPKRKRISRRGTGR